MLGMLLLATIGRSGALYQLLVWQFGQGKERGAGGLQQGGRVIETWGWGQFLLLLQVCRWKPRWQRPGDTCWEETSRAHVRARSWLSWEPTLPPWRATQRLLLLSDRWERQGVQLQVRYLLYKATDAAFQPSETRKFVSSDLIAKETTFQFCSSQSITSTKSNSSWVHAIRSLQLFLFSLFPCHEGILKNISLHCFCSLSVLTAPPKSHHTPQTCELKLIAPE